MQRLTWSDMDKKPAKHPLFNFRVEPQLLQRIDDLRRKEADIPTRSEMVRRIIMRAGDKKRTG